MSLGQGSFIANIVSDLSKIAAEVIVVTNQPEKYRDQQLAARIVQDIIPQRGPLSGVHAGLYHATYEVAFVVACDMPFWSEKLLWDMWPFAHEYQVVVPSQGEYLQPLHAFYHKSCLETMEQALLQNRRKITSFYDHVRVKYFDYSSYQDENTERVFFNINTRADYQQAQEFIDEGGQQVLTEQKMIWRWQDQQVEYQPDDLIQESPLTIHFNDNELVTLLCTPQHQDELAIGFLHAEGMIKTPEDVADIQLDTEKGIVQVKSQRGAIIAQETFMKRYVTTGCGKGTTFYNVMDSSLTKPVEHRQQIPGEQIINLMREFQKASELFRETGGVHSCALCDGQNILLFREDIGRHNATDKIMGRCFIDRIPLEDKLFLTSGRISSEILIKVAKMGIGIVASRSAPSELAVRLAEELEVTVIGFVRGNRMNIYTHPERIMEVPKQGVE